MSKCFNRGPSMHSWGPTHALKGPTSCYNFNRGALRMHSWGPHACTQGALRTHKRAPAEMLVNLFENHYILTWDGANNLLIEYRIFCHRPTHWWRRIRDYVEGWRKLAKIQVVANVLQTFVMKILIVNAAKQDRSKYT